MEKRSRAAAPESTADETSSRKSGATLEDVDHAALARRADD